MVVFTFDIFVGVWGQFLSYHVGSREGTQIVRLGDKHFYPQSHCWPYRLFTEKRSSDTCCRSLFKTCYNLDVVCFLQDLG